MTFSCYLTSGQDRACQRLSGDNLLHNAYVEIFNDVRNRHPELKLLHALTRNATFEMSVRYLDLTGIKLLLNR